MKEFYQRFKLVVRNLNNPLIEKKWVEWIISGLLPYIRASTDGHQFSIFYEELDIETRIES